MFAADAGQPITVYGLSRLEGPPACKHGQPVEQAALVGVQQRIAPLNGCAQGLVACRRLAWAVREQGEAIRQMVGDLLGREHSDSRGGKLDGERDAVQALTDLGNRRCVERVQREPGAGGRCPFQEQPHRFALQQALRLQGSSRSRHRQGCHLPDNLARNSKRLSTGGQHTELRAILKQCLDQAGTCSQQVLAVVEDEQQSTGVKRRDERRNDGITGLLAHAQTCRDRLGHQRRVSEGRQIDELNGFEVGVLDYLHRNTRLADAAWTGQRQQSSGLEQPAHFGELVVAADETGQRNGQALPEWHRRSCLVSADVSADC